MANRFSERTTWIEGSAIREIFKYLADPAVISLAGGNPSPDSFPKDDLADIAKEALQKDGEKILQYGMTKGIPSLLEEILKIENKRGVDVGMENILITTGSGQAIEIMTKTFIDKGDTVLVEGPSFLGALQTFKSYGANLVEVDMDEDGVLLSDVEQKLKKYNPKFLYVIPTFQNPTGVTLCEQRRQKLVELCSKYECKILEDDPYAQLRFTGDELSPLKKFDTDGTVVRLVSFSKLISPGVRVGAMIADEQCIGNFIKMKQGIDLHTPNITQVMVDEYLKSGKFEPHLNEVIASYKQKKDYMIKLINEHFPKEARVLKSEGGLFLWIELPETVDVMAMFKQAIEQEKVAFVPGTHFYANGGHNNTLRLNYSMVTMEKIHDGIIKLAKIIKQNI